MMEQVIISRGPSYSTGTFGTLFYKQHPICVTAERPWVNNQHGISCIPLGVYPCKPYQSPTKGLVWLLGNVTDRDMIEIHAANKPSQLEGCIAVGREFAMFGNEPGITGSVDTLKMLHDTLPVQFNLVIIQPT